MKMNAKKTVGIIGAGLSGLSCARELNSRGFSVTVFEKNKKPGGRVQTDHIDGFLLDHGFQIYLPSYPNAKKTFRHSKLSLKSFGAGAWLRDKEVGFKCFSDPLRNPLSVFKTLASNKATFKDKYLMLKLKSVCQKKIKKEKNLNRSTLDFLNDFGFSQIVIEKFFKPFFSGVFLEEKLSTPSHYFLFLFDKFSKSNAAVPEMGMGRLVDDLVSQMPEVKFKFNADVTDYDSKSITTNAETLDFDTVIHSGLKNDADSFNSVVTYYFKTKSNKFSSKFLYLSDEEKININHVACMSAVSKSYAPKDYELYSVNMIGDDEVSYQDILLELKHWFGEREISQWEFIKKYRIKKALPKNSHFGSKETMDKGVYLCGDYMESPSIEGALLSGIKVSRLV